MSNEMVERVARAIDDSLTGEVEMVVAGYFALRAAARAAIVAMREPTEDMARELTLRHPRDCDDEANDSLMTYQWAIDVALGFDHE